MTNNTPDYNDNLYFEDYVSGIKVEKSDKMTDCKNCKYTDEYCASGDCNKIQANDLACNKISLTEQWKKGELPEGKYWVKYEHWTDTVEMLDYSVGLFLDIDVPIDDDRIEQILAPVPSYEEWKASEKYNKHLEEKIKIYERKDKQATETSIAYNELAKENEELKEILERHKKATAKAQMRSCDLEIINAQLKELLKECREEIASVEWDSVVNDRNQMKLLTKIDEVLKCQE